MRTFLVSLVVALASFTFTVEYAEAKRLGGGGTFGKTFSSPTPKKVQPAPTQQKSTTDTAQSTKATQTATTAPKRSGFGGMMAGLLAGGLLGALFFGGAFEGVQLMDILLLAGAAFLIFKLFSMARRGKPQPQYATDGAQYEINPQRQQVTPEPVVNVKPTPVYSAELASQEPELPAWFNRKGFLDGARGHFMTLQKAWDRCDWDEIAGYTSEELLGLLKSERAKLPEHQTTEVVSVMAELANFIDEGDQVVVSINFYGWLKEDTDQTTEFSEVWHLSRDMRVENADWIIVGIEQP